MTGEPPDVLPALPAFAPWRDPEGRRRAAALTLAAAAWASLVQLGWIVLGIATMAGLIGTAEGDWIPLYDRIVKGVNGLWYVTLAASAVAFIAWQRRMIRNTAFLGCEHPEPSPALATLCWFVPFANLVVPLLSLLQVERWSRPAGRRPLTWVVAVWWTAWLAGSLPTVVAAVLHAAGDDAVLWISGQAASAVAILIRVAAAVLTVKLVATLTRRQQLLATFRDASPRLTDHRSPITDH